MKNETVSYAVFTSGNDFILCHSHSPTSRAPRSGERGNVVSEVVLLLRYIGVDEHTQVYGSSDLVKLVLLNRSHRACGWCRCSS